MPGSHQLVSRMGFARFLSVVFVVTLSGCGGDGAGSGGGGGLPSGSTLSAPVGLTAIAADQQVNLAWTAAVDASGYNVYWSQYSGIHPDTAASYEGMQTVSSTSLGVSDLLNGTRYHFIVTATAGSVESEAGDEVMATPTAPAAFNPTGGLNDTGIDWCADSQAAVAIEGATVEKRTGCEDLAVSYPRQDAHSGRDARFRDGQVPKHGGGTAGFDFSKISNSGAVVGVATELGSGPNDWACTRDNLTGLVWEVKVDDETHLRHRGWGYSWYDSVNNFQGSPGVESHSTTLCQDPSKQRCDTEKYVEDVNAAGLCGATDWRMPTVQELFSIANLGLTQSTLGPRAALDWDYFPILPTTTQKRYWSATPRASSSNSAFNVDYGRNGAVEPSFKSTPWYVMLVRGPVTP